MKRIMIIVFLLGLTIIFIACNNKEVKEVNYSIVVDGAQFDNDEFYIEVSRDIDTFNFNTNVTVEAYNEFNVCREITGESVILTKTVNLNDGDNIYYLVCKKQDGTYDVFKINIYKKQTLQVRYIINEIGYVYKITEVEEGSELSDIVFDGSVRGYKFIKWDYDFSKVVTSSIDIYGVLEAIEHKINYYLDDGVFESDNYPTIWSVKQNNSIPNPVKESHKFIGWYLDSNYITPFKSFYDISDDIYEINLYAKWEYTGIDTVPDNKWKGIISNNTPIYLTTCGQADTDLIGSIIYQVINDNIEKIENMFEGKSSFDEIVIRRDNLEASDVEEGAVVFMVVGGSNKGLGAAGTNVSNEAKRASDFATLSDYGRITLIVFHVGKEARRGDTSDPIIKAVAPNANMLVVVEGGNNDGYFTTISEENNIDLYLYTKRTKIKVVFEVLFGLN